MTIQIVRFKDGLDVVSQVNYINDEVELTNPMMFEIRNQNLLLQHWLPLAVMKQKFVTVPRTEILCTMDPNEDFTEYYETTVRKMNSVLVTSDKEEAEELIEAMEELESLKGVPIH
jgi:hypothetical protein